MKQANNSTFSNQIVLIILLAKALKREKRTLYFYFKFKKSYLKNSKLKRNKIKKKCNNFQRLTLDLKTEKKITLIYRS